LGPQLGSKLGILWRKRFDGKAQSFQVAAQTFDVYLPDSNIYDDRPLQFYELGPWLLVQEG